MQIVFLDTKTIGDVPNLKELNNLGSLSQFELTSPDKVIPRCIDADIVITNKVIFSKEVIEKLPKLKLICLAATGMNNIDLDFAKQKGIQVKNVSGYSTDSVAQSTFAMILSILNQCQYYDTFVKSGNYQKNEMFTHLGKSFWELNNKNFGIIGMGNIGKRVASIAQAFGCNVFYYSTSGNNKNAGYNHVDLDVLLKTCDIVSIHSPLNDKTNNLITLDKIKLMKPHAILANAGRGGIVNEFDLAKALDENIIAGAAVDVFSKEPISEENPLLHIKDKTKILFAPHIAWASIEARTLLVKKIAENIKEFQTEKK